SAAYAAPPKPAARPASSRPPTIGAAMDHNGGLLTASSLQGAAIARSYAALGLGPLAERDDEHAREDERGAGDLHRRDRLAEEEVAEEDRRHRARGAHDRGMGR